MIATRALLGLFWAALALSLMVGIFGRVYWTPDEPREADIAWRMSWQHDKAVPLLAGEAFCEKPPLTYWIAGAAISTFGAAARIARLPNLLYALITAMAVGAIARRGAGALAGLAAAAAISTFLLSYQVAIWLATDAPLLAMVAVALLGLYVGFYAGERRERLRGYSCMHAALAFGFLSKSAAAWMVPLLTLLCLVVWERRWRELLRWELYLGLVIQAAVIGGWVWYVYAGAQGPAHLKIFFWNNLVGRFAQVDAPQELQYAAAHRNSPGKYLIELPVYLWPWTLLVLAAVRRAWQHRKQDAAGRRIVRFAVASFLPTLAMLSFAATARNIYLAPALPGVALLLGWWLNELRADYDDWDRRALLSTACLLLGGTVMSTLAVIVVERDAARDALQPLWWSVGSAAVGLAVGGLLALIAWHAARRKLPIRAALMLLLAYCALLVGPASQIYARVNAWQDLGEIGRAIGRDSAGQPLILFAADETTRAFVDMYANSAAEFIAGPVELKSILLLQERLKAAPQSLIVAQIPHRSSAKTLHDILAVFSSAHRARKPLADSDGAPSWASASGLEVTRRYALPNGRHYALLRRAP